MRRALALPLLLLVAVLVAPEATIAEPPAWPTVIGSGNLVSGEISVLLLGKARTSDASDLERLASQVGKRCDLRLSVLVKESLGGELPTAPIVVIAGPIPTDDQNLLSRHRYERRGVVLDLRTDAFPADGGRMLLTEGLPVYTHASRPGLLHASREPGLDRLVLGVVRYALQNGHVPHQRSAFARVDGRVENEALVLECDLALPGKIALDTLTVEGETLLSAGPLRPIPLTRAHETIVRLRFTGEAGHTDEVRYWLPDLVPGMLPRIRILGPDEIALGERARFRVLVHDSAGRPVEGCTVSTTLPGVRPHGTTDAHGSATLELPAWTQRPESSVDLNILVEGERFRRAYPISLEVAERPRLAGLETDRPVYRPGDEVRLRAVLVDGLTRTGLTGEAIRIIVHDSRERVITVFEETTDRFGTAAFALPLSERIPEGVYRAFIDGEGASAAFRIAEIERPPFEIVLTLDRDPVPAGEEITGTVEVRTFDGVPLPGARVEMTVRGVRTTLSSSHRGSSSGIVSTSRSGSDPVSTWRRRAASG